MIHESCISYSRPVTDDWEAHCQLPAAAEYTRFIDKLRSNGWARLSIESHIRVGSQVAVSFPGSYTAIIK